MKSRTWMLGSIFNLLVVLFVATSTVYAAPIRVDCGKGGSIGGTLASLASAGNTRGVTIFVTGTCKENIFVYLFDHLTLQASPIATLQDVSNGTSPVVEIFNSYDVSLTGFTINGGSQGVNCDIDSYCTLYLNRIQQSGDGVRFGSSHGLVLSNNISNNASRGIAVVNGGSVTASSNTVSGNGFAGMVVGYGSNLTASSDTLQNNAIGIRVVQNSVLRGTDLTISGNDGDGVWLESASTAAFQQSNTGNVITGNGGNGVSVNDLSFAEFDNTNNVSGNLTQPDVACNPQYSATRGSGTVGGTSNCAEPQHKR
jgi:parallel beta-helix repeat protein